MRTEKALTTAKKERACTYSELLATSPSNQANPQEKLHLSLRPSDSPPQSVGLIVKAADPNTLSCKAKKLVKEVVDPKALKLGVSKLKNLANNALFFGMQEQDWPDILGNELSKLSTVTTECPKRKLPTLLLMYVPKDVEYTVNKDKTLQQNNLTHMKDPFWT